MIHLLHNDKKGTITGHDHFWQYNYTYWLQKLNSSPNGLSQFAVDKNAKKNVQKNKPYGIAKDILLFAGQFKSPLMLLLVGAVIISAFLSDTSDVFIILFVLLSTGILSFLQERNAGKVVEKLQAMISLKSRVLRDGLIKEIDSTELLEGDILLLQAGDRIPADCLIIESNELHANESSLTGESYPVRKESCILDKDTTLPRRRNSLWEGTNIISGKGRAIIVNTGENTLFGNICRNALQNPETAFEKGIKNFGYFLMRITLSLALVILVINLLGHKSVIESALFALALAVGMAPELLPAITTVSMSAGAKRMLEKKVIVKKLSSIQNLGELDVLCTDKTGTVTEGIMKIAGFVDVEGRENEFVKQLAFWNASFETGYINPIDVALRELTSVAIGEAQKIVEIPYDFIRKRLSIAVTLHDKKLLITKGAFRQVTGICTSILDNNNVNDISAYQKKLEDEFEQFGKKGVRAIAVCYKYIDATAISKEDETEMIFAGFLLMGDPVKIGISDTIKELNKLEVGLKIITGDNKNIARSIGLAIGISEPVVVTGKELASISTEALEVMVKTVHIFAEVEPQQKERIIIALKRNYTVGYMGDGINDVSAIRAADVGISVSNAVDIAREAADFVLMENNLMVLAEGIKEGRKTFSNTLKYIYISTGSTFGNMCSVAIASLVLPFLPMLPKQILLTNFITDFPYLSVASDSVDITQLKKPGRWNLKLIRNYMFFFGVHSSLFDMITFCILLFILKVSEIEFQTGWFIVSVLSELMILFVVRTHKAFFKSRPGKYLMILSSIAIVVTIVIPYLPIAKTIGLVPMAFKNYAMMLLIVCGYVYSADILKIWFFKKFQRPRPG